MALLARVNWVSQQRVDLQHLLAEQSFSAADFRGFSKLFSGSSKNYIIAGLDIKSVSGLTLTIGLANALIMTPLDTSSAFFVGESDLADETILVPQNTTLFVEAYFTRVTNVPAITAQWDASAVTAQNPSGTEFTSSIDFEEFVQVNFRYSNSGFSANGIKIAKITTNNSQVVTIVDCRDLFYRLATGGAAPDFAHKFEWSNNRSEANLIGDASALGQLTPLNPYFSTDSVGARNDKAITSLKTWMDAVMTSIAEVKGTPYWYSSVAQFVNQLIFFDSINGSSVVPNINYLLMWYPDLFGPGGTVTSFGNGPLSFAANFGYLKWNLGGTFLPSSRQYNNINFTKSIASTGIQDYAIFLRVEREKQPDVANTNAVVTWVSPSVIGGQPQNQTVVGSPGDFTGIAVGDFVRKATDGYFDYHEVTGFYSGVVINIPGAIADNTATAIFLDDTVTSSSDVYYWFRANYVQNDIYYTSSNANLLTNDGVNLVPFDTSFQFLGRISGDFLTWKESLEIFTPKDTPYDAIVTDAPLTDVPGTKLHSTTQAAITATPNQGFILIDKDEAVTAQLDLLGKKLNFVFNGSRSGWHKSFGSIQQIGINFSLVPTVGTWRIEWNFQESADLAFNATALDVENAFNLFSGHSGVTVTGNYSTGFEITFAGLNSYPLPTFFSVGVDETQRLTFGGVPDAGAFRIAMGVNQTINIPFDSTNIEIQDYINALPNVQDVEVTGTFGSGFNIHFRNADGKQNWPQFTLVSNSLTNSSIPISLNISTLTEGQYPADNLKATLTPVIITSSVIIAGSPIGPNKLLEVGADKTSFIGHGIISGFDTAIDLKGFKDVDIELTFESVINPIVDTITSVQPQTRYHRNKSFGLDDRNILVVGNSTNPGEFNSLVDAVAAAIVGNKIIVTQDQFLTTNLVINKAIDIEFINNAKLRLSNLISGTVLTLTGPVRTKHLHLLVDVSGGYSDLISVDGTAGHHSDLYIETSGVGVAVNNAFIVAVTASSCFIDGVIQIGSSTVTNVLLNNSGVTSHNVNIRDISNGIVHDLFNRRPPIQETPSGLVNGVNAVFSLSEVPASNQSVLVMVDSVPRLQTTHYTLVGQTITFNAGSIPANGQDVYAYYLPSGLVTAPPSARSGAIEVSLNNAQINLTTQYMDFGAGLSVANDPFNSKRVLITATGGGGSGDLSAVAQDIIPDADSTRSIGAPTKGWQQIYLSDQSNTDVYRLEVISGVLQIVLVP